MACEEFEFQSTDAEASHTYPMEAGKVRLQSQCQQDHTSCDHRTNLAR